MNYHNNNLLKILVPILITCWKRPEKAFKLIESLRSLKPNKIYAACDGPDLNDLENKKKVNATKEILLNSIDWNCELKTLFNEKNNGCRYAITKAINWFFDNEYKGIILEDDCIPSKEFLILCSDLLVRYREDNRIWTISGSNFQQGKWRGDGSYYFSKYFHCWGWATWRNRWIKFDSDLNAWKNNDDEKLIQSIFESKKEQKYWFRIFDKLAYENEPDSWAYRWMFTCFINNGLSIIPNKNLVENIGFDDNATNTSFNLIDTSIQNGLLPINHPKSIRMDVEADKYTFDNHFDTSSFGSKLKKAFNNPLYYPKRTYYFFRKIFV